MIKFLFFYLFLFISLAVQSQNIKYIAAYDNNSSTTSGLFAVGDTALYRYSWYYQEWFPLSNNGLVKINDTVQINALCVYNNESTNSSGIFVFSDTAVFNYNWIMASWYILSNNGLPRLNQKPIVNMLTVYGPAGGSSNSTLFALSDTAVFRYSWFYQQWTPLSNNGLVTKNHKYETNAFFDSKAYPNPFSDNLNINVDLTKSHTDKLKIAFFDISGNLVYEEVFPTHNLKSITVTPNLNHLKQGLYFCEIYDGNSIKILKAIKIE